MYDIAKSSLLPNRLSACNKNVGKQQKDVKISWGRI